MSSALIVRNISVGYGGSTILDDVSIEIPEGKFTALIGPNGCGKSTLLKSVIRSLPLLGGRIEVRGTDLHRISARMLARQMSMLPQSLHAPDGVTVEQLVGYGRSPYSNLWGRLTTVDRGIVASAMERMNMVQFADQQVSNLSGGQQQRAWLAMVLAQATPIILLDEPTTFLDISHQMEVLNLCRDLARAGHTVVAVLHDLNQAFRYADHVVVLKSGRVVTCGSADGVATESNLLSTFDISTRIISDPESGRPMMVVRQEAGQAPPDR